MSTPSDKTFDAASTATTTAGDSAVQQSKTVTFSSSAAAATDPKVAEEIKSRNEFKTLCENIERARNYSKELSDLTHEQRISQNCFSSNNANRVYKIKAEREVVDPNNPDTKKTEYYYSSDSATYEWLSYSDREMEFLDCDSPASTTYPNSDGMTILQLHIDASGKMEFQKFNRSEDKFEILPASKCKIEITSGVFSIKGAGFDTSNAACVIS